MIQKITKRTKLVVLALILTTLSMVYLVPVLNSIITSINIKSICRTIPLTTRHITNNRFI